MRTLLKKGFKKLKYAYAVKLAARQRNLLPGTIERVYHVHIRKSAGTSINAAFWGLTGLSLRRMGRKPLVIKKRRVFVRNNLHYIESGNFLYANSHIPFWNLKLPEHTFTFCMLRDPYERLVSLYKYYLWVAAADPQEAAKKEPYYKSLLKNKEWVASGFSGFLEKVPPKHRMNQLYMFSETFNVLEAIENSRKLDRVYFQDSFGKAIDDLSHSLQLPLLIKKERSFNSEMVFISETEEQQARALLKKEYEFYKALKNEKKYL